MSERNSTGDDQSADNSVKSGDVNVENYFGEGAAQQNGDDYNTETTSAEIDGELEADGRPVLELFVKAAVDKLRNGGCPTCHRYFLIFYILREKGLIDLVVTTFLPENPPKEVLEMSSGKHYPLVKVHRGIDSFGNDMTGIECDTVDEIEALVSRFDCSCMVSSRQSAAEALAEKCSQNLYTVLLHSINNIPPTAYSILALINSIVRRDRNGIPLRV